MDNCRGSYRAARFLRGEEQWMGVVGGEVEATAKSFLSNESRGRRMTADRLVAGDSDAQLA